MIMAIATIAEGIAACSVLLFVLQHRSSSAVAARIGVTNNEWIALGLVALGIIGCTVLLTGALSFRLITFLRGEPVGSLRCWLQALQSAPTFTAMALGRWWVAITTRPLRRGGRAGGVSVLFGSAFAASRRMQAAFGLPVFVAEGLKGKPRRSRSKALFASASIQHPIIDTPLSLAVLLTFVLLAGTTTLAWNVSIFLGLVVGLLGLMLAANALSLLGSICSIALYIYLTNDAPTLGFQADDLQAMVSERPRSKRRRHR